MTSSALFLEKNYWDDLERCDLDITLKNQAQYSKRKTKILRIQQCKDNHSDSQDCDYRESTLNLLGNVKVKRKSIIYNYLKDKIN